MLTTDKSLIPTCNFGKLFSKLKSTEAKSMVALTLSLSEFLTIVVILSLKRNGVTASTTIKIPKVIKAIFSTFLSFIKWNDL